MAWGEPRKLTLELDLTRVISEAREAAQALNEFADNLEQIEKKYEKPQNKDLCDFCADRADCWLNYHYGPAESNCFLYKKEGEGKNE